MDQSERFSRARSAMLDFLRATEDLDGDAAVADLAEDLLDEVAAYTDDEQEEEHAD